MGRTVTLRPNGMPTVGGGYWFRYPGSVAIGSGDWSYLQDNNDGTYLYGIMSNVDTFMLDFTSYTLASNERCSEARLIQRIAGTSDSFSMALDSWIAVGAGNMGWGDGGGASYRGVYPRWQQLWNPGYGADFTQAAIDALRAGFRKVDDVTTPSISEVYLDLWINTQPTIGITSPTTNQRLFSRRPTLSWNYDAKGDSVREHQVKVFTAATVEGGGFNVDTSPAVWSSQPAGAANSATVGVDLTHGVAYYYYVRIATDYRGASWWSSWASVRFIINSPSVTSAVTVTPATPITTTNQPTIGWTYTDPDTDAQEHYYVRVFPESEYSKPTFTPDTDVGATWYSGTVASSTARSAQTGPLSPNVNYKAWVYTTDAGSGTRWSTPAVSSVFVIQTAPGVVFDQPAVPEVQGITTDADNQRLAVTLQGRGNLLTRNQASIDSGTVGWENDGNATLARNTSVFLAGGGSLSLTTVAAGEMRARTLVGTSGFPVTPGRTYTALGSLRSAATARSVRLDIRWYDSAGTYLSPSTGAAVTTTTTGWTQAICTATAPASAAYAAVVILVLATTAASEVHYADNLSFAPGTSVTWTRGGLVLELGALADTFTRANSTTTLGTAETGGAWAAQTGTWGIIDNRAYMNTVTADAMAVLTSSYLVDGYVEADITLSAVRALAGLVFRNSDANNTMHVQLVRFGTTDQINLYKRVSGTWTLLASVAGAGLVLGTTYKLRVEFYGGQVNVYLAGVLRISYLMLAGELNQFGSYGKHGIYVSASATWDDNGSRIDNFKAGNAATQKLTLQRSLDAGVTWAQVRSAGNLQPLDQQAIVYDYEVPPGVLAQYRAIATASEAGNTVTSSYSATVAQTTALTITRWWLKDAVDPTLNMAVTVAPPFNFKRKETMATFDPVGRAQSVFVSDGAKGIEGQLNVWVHDKTTYDKLQKLLGNGRALLLQDPLGRSWWVKFGEQDWELIRAQPQSSETTPIRHFHGLSLPFVEVGAPAVV